MEAKLMLGLLLWGGGLLLQVLFARKYYRWAIRGGRTGFVWAMVSLVTAPWSWAFYFLVLSDSEPKKEGE